MNKTVRLDFRFTSQTANTIKKKSELAGVTMTEYITRLIHSDLEPIEKDTLRGIYKELAAIGNNINQIAHKMNMDIFDENDMQLITDFKTNILEFKLAIAEMRKKYE